MPIPILLISAVIILSPLYFVVAVAAATTTVLNTVLDTAAGASSTPGVKWFFKSQKVCPFQKYKARKRMAGALSESHSENETEIIQTITKIGSLKNTIDLFIVHEQEHEHGHEKRMRTKGIMARTAKWKQLL